MLTLITPYQKKRQKILKTSTNFLSWERRSKRKMAEEGRKLVQNKQSVRRGRYGRRSFVGHFVFPTFPQRAVRLSFVGQNGQFKTETYPNYREILIKYQKRPTSITSRPRFSDNKWNKDAAESDNRLNTQECNKWGHETIVHSSLIRCMYIQRIQISLGEPCCS